MSKPRIYLNDPDFTLYNGDAREALRELPDESVHMCVTSPPFFGLRDYGTGTWEGGDAECDHRKPHVDAPKDSTSTLESRASNQNHEREPWPNGSCGKCGARRIDRQIGLEESPEAWVAQLVEVFEEVKRVLRKDGTLWIECGDSYDHGSNKERGERETQSKIRADRGAAIRDGKWDGHGFWRDGGGKHSRHVSAGLKPKDLIGQPFLLAFALREAGWYWRNVCIWHKPNPMPESVRDRFTVSHSYVLLFSKSPRYFFDAEAVREGWADERMGASGAKVGTPEGYASAAGRGGDQGLAKLNGSALSGRNARSVWTIATEPLSASVRSVRQIRVAADEAAYGIARTGSEGCPVHAGLPDGPYTERDDEHAAHLLSRSESSDDRLAQAPPDGTAATLAPTELLAAPGTEDAPGLEHADAAIPRDTGSSRTGLAPATSPADTPSAQTPDRTGDTSASPAFAELDLSIPESNIGPDGLRVADPSERILDHIARMCTCSYEGEITEETGHYAAFPQALAERCIKAGTSERGCCPECGAPWVRVTKLTDEHASLSSRPKLRELDREQFRLFLIAAREKSGLSRAELDRKVGANGASAWWEGRNYLGEFIQQIPSWEMYQRLKDALALSNEYDDCIQRVEQPRYEARRENRAGIEVGATSNQAPRGSGISHDLKPREVLTLGWRPSCECKPSGSDGLDQPGVWEFTHPPVPCTVLDPFLGSGTTALVARRLGRKCIGIELNERYCELAAERTKQLSLLSEDVSVA